MLVSLGKKQHNGSSVRERLLDCHTRIRTFCVLAKRLAAGGPDDEVRQAALDLDRYFRIGLPLHVRDEEESVRPRLERVGGPEVAEALEVMSREHVEIEAALDELLARWQELATAPTAAACAATQLGAIWLALHMRNHLHAEETRVFPALELLPPAQHEAIVAEMRSRRAT